MRLLYLGPEDSLEHVRDNLADNFVIEHALDETGVSENISNYDVVLDAYMRIRFPAELIGRAANLKLFITATTGADHVDGEALAKKDIPLLTLKDKPEVIRNITAAAEHSWLLLMACARQLPGAITAVLGYDWDRNKFPGVMLRGKTLGIIGCGRIGQWMAQYATAFGMKCLGFDPHLQMWPGKIKKDNLNNLLSSSDFVSIHIPLNDETRGLLGEKEFALMKHGTTFINTSRGEIVDESALLSALKKGQIKAAGLDVVCGEPEVQEHPLINYAKTHSNLIITPHIGGYSPDALKYVLEYCCTRIENFFSN